MNLVGVPNEDRHQFHRWSQVIVESFGNPEASAEASSEIEQFIDIALCRKDWGIEDFLRRFSVQAEKLLVVGDSMQTGGPELDMVEAAPGSMGVQVGVYQPPRSLLQRWIYSDAIDANSP